MARTYSIVAFGLSVFEQQGTAYAVSNFHFSLITTSDFMCSPASLSFLVNNGFDFNDQLLNGIPYTPGDHNGKLQTNVLMREIFMEIATHDCPVIVHNGLLDVMFLYQSLFADLPQSLPVFIADIATLFKGGICDTKYLADFVVRQDASFLSYLFRKCERLQAMHKADGEAYLECNISNQIELKSKRNTMSLAQLGLAPPQSAHSIDTGKPYCEQYAAHGHCVNGSHCKRSHDLDVILDSQLNETSKVSKKARLDLQPALVHQQLKPESFEKYHSGNKC